jgi:hypothetical protein
MIFFLAIERMMIMNKRELIKQHITQLSLDALLRYRLLLCVSELNEDLELDIIDLFKYPARLQTSYCDNWQKDVLKTLYSKLKGEFESPNKVNEEISDLISKQIFSDKDNRTIILFESFLASLKSDKVVMIHSSLHRKLDQLTF